MALIEVYYTLTLKMGDSDKQESPKEAPRVPSNIQSSESITVDDQDKNKKKTKTRRTVFGVDTSDVPWEIYVSRALSAWGDRMWSYGSGLFLTS